MANLLKNIDLFDDGYEPDAWKKEYWRDKAKNQTPEHAELAKQAASSVDTVIKKRDKEGESKDFHQAQLDISKDILPAQTIADRVRPELFDQQLHRNEDFAHQDKMTPTPLDAYNKVYPSGNNVPTSAAMKPTSIADFPASGYKGDDSAPQGRIGSLELDVKGNTAKWIGNYYLPKQTQDNKNDFTPPVTQISSANTDENQCNEKSPVSLNIGNLIEQALLNKNMNHVVDLSGAIASTKKKQVLNKPFKTPDCKAAYAVYTENDKGAIVYVPFNACQAVENPGPRWGATYWGSKVQEGKAEEVSLNELSNFYTERVTDPKKDGDWDGKTFHRKAELLNKMPELVNSQPSYEDETVINKDPNTASSAPINPDRAQKPE